MITYREPARGTVVAQIQKIIGAYPDGIWGKATTECLKAWQRSHGLTADGIAGPATLTKMGLSAVGLSAVAQQNTQLPATLRMNYCGKAVVMKRSKRRIDYIAIHCTATPEGNDTTVEEMRKQHKAQGWSDIGYHYVIYRDGTVNLGRDVDIAGAHVSGYNAHSIGICYVGGLENLPGVPYEKLPAKDTRTEEQKASMLALLMDLRKLYPKAVIQGHRDFSPDRNGDGVISPDEWLKACPSFAAKEEFRRV